MAGPVATLVKRYIVRGPDIDALPFDTAFAMAKAAGHDAESADAIGQRAAVAAIKDMTAGVRFHNRKARRDAMLRGEEMSRKGRAAIVKRAKRNRRPYGWTIEIGPMLPPHFGLSVADDIASIYYGRAAIKWRPLFNHERIDSIKYN